VAFSSKLALQSYFVDNLFWGEEVKLLPKCVGNGHFCDICVGHDCSVRLWNIESKTCVQEITVHRKKFEESVNDVAFHPTKPLLASAGADAVAKIYV